MKKLVLIDSHAIIHRAYHALPVLTTPAGEPVQAVYGFTTILMRILRELKPDYIAAAFDLPGPTFRHIAYERYKAQRPEAPSDLASQFGKVREISQAFGITVFEKEGYEADDIIGTIAKRLEKKKDVETIIVTGDMDTLQLVRPRLKVCAMRKGITDTVMYDEKAVEERYGFSPEKMIDYKGLKGDPSDNIPGVKGIGEKTATELIRAFGSIAAVYAALRKGTKKIVPSLAGRLRAGEEDAELSRSLAEIRTDVPIDFSLGDVRWTGTADKGAVRTLFIKFGFASLIKRLDPMHGTEASPPKTSLKKAGSPAPPPMALPLKMSEAIKKIATARALLIFVKQEKKGSLGLLREGDALFLVGAGGGARECAGHLFKEAEAKEFFQSRRDWYLYDAKTLIHFFRGHDTVFGGAGFDLLPAAYVAEPFSRDFSYPAIAARELGLNPGNLREALPHFFETAASLEAKLKVGNLQYVFEKIEMPLAPVLAEMEERGIAVDRQFLAALGKRVDKLLAKITGDIYEAAGEEFNINSPVQLSRILFEKMGIKTHGLRKTEKGGVISTRESELEKLESSHPIIGKILEHRELTKLKTTYIEALPALIDEKTGRLHTTFNQTGTATGRLSSATPNLQNIPIMTETGREIRKAFVAKPGFLLVSFDYSQIELRVAAHLAQDQKMIEAFRKGLDIHRMTAAEIYNVPLDKVTPELRRAAKTLNFGVLYGMGPRAFAESTGFSREQAKKFIDEYFRDFAGIHDYIERTKEFVAEHGYVETLFGRRRWIPEIHSPNWQLRREAERMAVNHPIQGTSTGDIIKLAMIAVDRWVKKEKLEDEARLLLQVHDELLFEIKASAVKKTAPRIKEIMENAVELKVPLVVDVKVGKNWGEQMD